MVEFDVSMFAFVREGIRYTRHKTSLCPAAVTGIYRHNPGHKKRGLREWLEKAIQNHPPKWTDSSKEHHFTMCVPIGTPLWEPRPAPLTGNELTKHCMHTMCPPQLKVDSQSHLQL